MRGLIKPYCTWSCSVCRVSLSIFLALTHWQSEGRVLALVRNSRFAQLRTWFQPCSPETNIYLQYLCFVVSEVLTLDPFSFPHQPIFTSKFVRRLFPVSHSEVKPLWNRRFQPFRFFCAFTNMFYDWIMFWNVGDMWFYGVFLRSLNSFFCAMLFTR